MSTSGGAEGAGLATRTAHLVAAQILTLFTAPTIIVPAPGAGKMIVPLQVFTEWAPGLDQYEVNTPQIAYDSNRAGGMIATVGGALVLSSATASVELNAALGGVSWQGVEYAKSVAADKPITLSQSDSMTTPGGNPLARGPIVTSTLAAGGAGYAPGDVGTIDFDGIAAYVVDTVGALGTVLTYHLTNVGVGYDTISNPLDTTATTGVGTGLTLNVTAIPPADGDLYVTTLYRVFAFH